MSLPHLLCQSECVICGSLNPCRSWQGKGLRGQVSQSAMAAFSLLLCTDVLESSTVLRLPSASLGMTWWLAGAVSVVVMRRILAHGAERVQNLLAM